MDHERFMDLAVRLAGRGAGRTSPNPAVGAVIARGGRVVASGYHRGPGLPHAEVEAIRRLNGRARGAVLYVTLEPCCHHGRTPPCTEAIIASGIKKVVVGTPDPNPLVSGKGITALRRAGIEVTEGVLEEKCRSINPWYEKYITTGRPYVILKLASSLDGRIATPAGESQWITGPPARRFVHKLRSRVDAVMVGSGTVIKDDPRLTARLERRNIRQPARVIMDATFSTPLGARVFDGIEEAPLFIFTSKGASREKIERARRLGAVVVSIDRTRQGLSLKAATRVLGRRGITSVMIEGGGRLAASALKTGIVDRVFLFLSPIFLGADSVPAVAGLGLKGLGAAPCLEDVKARRIGVDILIEGRPSKRRG